MKKLYENPLIRIVGVIIILYFGLFYNKSSQKSLGNRLSKEEIEKSFSKAKQEGNHFMAGLRKVTELKNQKANGRPVDNIRGNGVQTANIDKKVLTSTVKPKTDESNKKDNGGFVSVDIKKGLGEQVKCADKIVISYAIYDHSGKVLKREKNYSLIIGKGQFDSRFENSIIGMKKGGIRMVLNRENPEEKKLIKVHGGTEEIANYYVELLKVEAAKQNQDDLPCNTNSQHINY